MHIPMSMINHTTRQGIRVSIWIIQYIRIYSYSYVLVFMVILMSSGMTIY